MEPLNEALRLLRRHAEVEDGMRGRGGIGVTAGDQPFDHR